MPRRGFEEIRTVLTVTVPIRYRAKPGDADGHTPTQLERQTWASTIRTSSSVQSGLPTSAMSRAAQTA